MLNLTANAEGESTNRFPVSAETGFGVPECGFEMIWQLRESTYISHSQYNTVK
jgi:hypothetical protein